MKRIALAGLLLAVLSRVALAANVTPTPIVGPNETGENSAGQQQVTDTARIKVGSCTVITTGSEAAQAGTCNGGAGVITMGFSMTKTSGGVDLITITNSKVQAGDMVYCTLDNTGAAAAAAAFCSAAAVSAGQVIFQVSNASATSPAAALKVYFFVNTQGNPN